MDIIRRYRIFLCICFMIQMILAGFTYYEYCKNEIPDCIYLTVDESFRFDYQIPVMASVEQEEHLEKTVDMGRAFQMQAKTPGSYTMDTRLFGIFELKKVKIEAKERQSLSPDGRVMGIYLETDGVFVIDTSEIQTSEGKRSPAGKKIKSGDYITKINGTAVRSKIAFSDMIARSEGKAVILTIIREGNHIYVKVVPELDVEDQTYKIGVQVRNNTQGIGTLTYMKDRSFAALGHGVNDLDLGSLLSICGGEVYEAEIGEVKKGKKGSPGEIVGYIEYSRKNLCGNIRANTQNGIYGTMDEKSENKEIPIGWKQEVKEGKAYIQSDVSGKMEQYEIDIEEVDQGNQQKKKGMKIRVTDPELLACTNGIVQGMSGSPIIQEGKIIGAVTHVFVNDPTRGYGIFIEEMLGEY